MYDTIRRLMPEFTRDDKIPMVDGGEAEILTDEPLGSGGQGEVYKVRYCGKDYALKWYTSEKIKENKTEFRNNLQSNIDKGEPTKQFLWPQFLTEELNGSFGYLMDLIPSNYDSFSDILRTYKLRTNPDGSASKIPVGFKKLDTMILAALHIIKSFRDLQRHGYCYQDLNDGGFYIDTDTGDVLICDCDNVSPDGITSGIRGKPGYMAPEIVTNESFPNANSDKFSLAVILFKLLMHGDPLEGKNVCRCVVMTGSAELKYYGTDPVFIFDKNNDSNRPVNGIHNNVIKNWGLYPQYIRDAFEQVFTDGLKHPEKRIILNEWFKIMNCLRSEIVCCDCGRFQSFLSCHEYTNKFTCPKCGKTFNILEVNGSEIALTKGTELHYNQIVDPDTEDYVTTSAVVVENRNKPGLLGLKNKSDKIWQVRYPENKNKDVKPEGGTVIVEGMSIDFGQKINNFVKVITGRIKE